jgi:signal transduction histidine kinase
MQHWMEVAELEPEKLIEVFNERKLTVSESVNYLENLARGSSRLQPRRAASAVNVNQIIHDLLKSYQNLPHRRIRFLLRLHPSALCVRGDAVQLRRAFENILQNALDAVKEDGMISVSTESSNDQVLVTWNDNGAGIPDNVRRQLFQTHVTTKPEGTGQGLANVKQIVDDFGGQVTIESEPGRGTTVRFALLQTNGDKHD